MKLRVYSEGRGGVKILERLERRERDSFETGHEENKEKEGVGSDLIIKNILYKILFIL
jgi:hypothetical protein